jgi:hypothetical protein
MSPYLEKTHHKNRAGGVTQGEGPEFKPQYCNKKNIYLEHLEMREFFYTDYTVSFGKQHH